MYHRQKGTFRNTAAYLVAHFALLVIALGESLLLALIVIGGIYLPNRVSSSNPVGELMVDYSGLEGVLIFILGSVSLIRDIFTKEGSRDGD